MLIHKVRPFKLAKNKRCEIALNMILAKDIFALNASLTQKYMRINYV